MHTNLYLANDKICCWFSSQIQHPVDSILTHSSGRHAFWRYSYIFTLHLHNKINRIQSAIDYNPNNLYP